MMVGGGGYTIENVARFIIYLFNQNQRCWANETAYAVGIELPSDIPKNTISYDLYKPDYKLHV